MTNFSGPVGSPHVCSFVPPYLLERMGRPELVASDLTLRAQRVRQTAVAPAALSGAWEIHDAHNSMDLPGDLVRGASDPAVDDPAVNEAADGIAATLTLLEESFGRDSYDDEGAGVLGTVHYGTDYDNAFWNGTQLVFGDGDGTVFDRFTKPVDVLAHELMHAVTEKTAGLTYQGQSGALNESVSDMMGACVKQAVLGLSAAEGSWLVGEGIFLPGVKGVALRSMKDPGTAYDDPTLGKDPQVGSMDDYVETTDDDGGVHINSGIPNRAFYLAATAIGGTSAAGAGQIWYAALTSGISPDIDFAGFAEATVAAAGEHTHAVRTAWTSVGVLAEGAAG